MPIKVIREENKLYEKLKKLFHSRFVKILDQLKKEGLPSSDLQRKELLHPLIELEGEYINTIIEGTKEALRYGRQDVFNNLQKIGYLKVKKAKSTLEVIFRDFSPEILKIIRNKTFIASQKTMDRIIGDVMESLSKSYAQGLGIDKAADVLEEKFVSMENYELRRIARTEINQAQNKGAFYTEQELGVEYHQWIATIDGRQRESHEILNGEIVRVGEPFSNGLLYPGDTSGDIEEWINCRCREVPFLMPEGYMAPPGVLCFYEEDLVRID